jgi:hypothetical protein
MNLIIRVFTRKTVILIAISRKLERAKRVNLRSDRAKRVNLLKEIALHQDAEENGKEKAVVEACHREKHLMVLTFYAKDV